VVGKFQDTATFQIAIITLQHTKNRLKKVTFWEILVLGFLYFGHTAPNHSEWWCQPMNQHIILLITLLFCVPVLFYKKTPNCIVLTIGLIKNKEEKSLFGYDSKQVIFKYFLNAVPQFFR
jgi:hypothetical protein